MQDMYYNQEVIQKCLEVLSYTAKDLEPDFRETISKSNQSGIYSNTWGRRSDMFELAFKDNPDIRVLHIPRGKLWQFDPIFNTVTGELIVCFAKNNFNTIRKKYFKKGHSSHYSLSLLLKNEGLYPNQEVEQLSLFKFDDEEKARKQADLVKMLGLDCEHVTRVRFLIVDYVYQRAVSAILADYTPQFLLVNSTDVSHLLPSVADTIMTEVEVKEEFAELANEPQLVSLKEKRSESDV